METLTSTAAKSKYEKDLHTWIEDEKAAIELIGIIGTLWFDKSVELIIFRNQLVDRSTSEILNLHQYAKNIVKQHITVRDTLALARELAKLDLAPARIDIGRLGSEWLNEQGNYSSVAAFVGNKLKDFLGKEKRALSPKDVVLYGFGRIGRLAARELIAQAGSGEQLRLRAVVTRTCSPEELTKRADLLRTDSVHGPFPGTVIEDLENSALIVNGHTVHFIGASNPAEIDYTKYGINNALLIDNTGVKRDREGLFLLSGEPARG